MNYYSSLHRNEVRRPVKRSESVFSTVIEVVLMSVFIASVFVGMGVL